MSNLCQKYTRRPLARKNSSIRRIFAGLKCHFWHTLTISPGFHDFWPLAKNRQNQAVRLVFPAMNFFQQDEPRTNNAAFNSNIFGL